MAPNDTLSKVFWVRCRIITFLLSFLVFFAPNKALSEPPPTNAAPTDQLRDFYTSEQDPVKKIRDLVTCDSLIHHQNEWMLVLLESTFGHDSTSSDKALKNYTIDDSIVCKDQAVLLPKALLEKEKYKESFKRYCFETHKYKQPGLRIKNTKGIEQATTELWRALADD